MKEFEIRLKKALATKDKWALRALEIVFNNQTADEVAEGRTKKENGVGFTAFDADILTSLAIQYQVRGWLSDKQLQIVKRTIPKYWRQIVQVADIDKLEKTLV